MTQRVSTGVVQVLSRVRLVDETSQVWPNSDLVLQIERNGELRFVTCHIY